MLKTIALLTTTLVLSSCGGGTTPAPAALNVSGLWNATFTNTSNVPGSAAVLRFNLTQVSGGLSGTVFEPTNSSKTYVLTGNIDSQGKSAMNFVIPSTGQGGITSYWSVVGGFDAASFSGTFVANAGSSTNVTGTVSLNKAQ